MDSISPFTFEILMEFDDFTAVGNAGSVTAANLLLDSSRIYSIVLSFTRMYISSKNIILKCFLMTMIFKSIAVEGYFSTPNPKKGIAKNFPFKFLRNL
jgi:hypothetical protein